MRRSQRGERIFVLAGGANLGAVQAGQLDVLLSAGVLPDRIIGCSVGALNGAFVALEPTAERATQLVDLWISDRVSRIFQTSKLNVARKLAARADHLVDPSQLRTLIRTELPVADLAELQVPTEVLTTSLTTGKQRWFSSGDPVAVLTASAALPGIFPPVVIEDDVLVDGGVTDARPVQRAFTHAPNEVWVLDTPDRQWETSGRMHALEVLLRSFSVACDWPGGMPDMPDGVTLHHLETSIPAEIKVGFDDFKHSAALVEVGRDSARSAIDRIAAGQSVGRWGRRRGAH